MKSSSPGPQGPGDPIWQQEENWVARIKRAMTNFKKGRRRHLGGPHSRAMTIIL
jgi:hypothetical protein